MAIAKEGTGNRLFGELLAADVEVVFAPLYSWALWKASQELTEPLSKVEKELLKRTQNLFTKVTTYVLSVMLGVASVSPQAYFSYQYNNQKLLYPALIFACDSQLPIYSMKMNFDSLFHARFLKKSEREFQPARNLLSNQIDTIKEVLLLMTPEIRNTQINRLLRNNESIQSNSHEDGDFYQIVEELLSLQRQKKYETCHKVIRFMCESFGLGTACTNLALLFKGTVSACEEFSQDSTLNNTLASGITGVITQVLVRSSMEAASNIGSRVFNFITRQPTPKLSNTLAPRVSLGFEMLGTALAAFSYGPNVPLSKEYFGDNMFGNLIAGSISIHLIFLILHSLGDVVDGSIISYFESKGTEAEKDLILLFERLTRLQKLYNEAPLLEIMKHIKILPASTQIRLDEAIPNIHSKIDAYLNIHGSRSKLNKGLLEV